MRVALCLSGLPRTFKTCYPSVKENIIDVVKPDIFISTWDVINSPHFEIEGPVRYGDEGTLDELKALYRPTFFEVEEYKNEENKIDNSYFNQTRFLPRKHPHVSITRHLSMLYKIFKANQLARVYESLNAFRYDIIIKCRMDLKITKPIDIQELESAANSTSIFYTDVIRRIDGMISDILFFGPSQMMHMVCEKFWLTDTIYNLEIEFNIEKTFRYLLDSLKLECREHSMKPEIIRPEHVRW